MKVGFQNVMHPVRTKEALLRYMCLQPTLLEPQVDQISILIKWM